LKASSGKPKNSIQYIHNTLLHIASIFIGEYIADITIRFFNSALLYVLNNTILTQLDIPTSKEENLVDSCQYMKNYPLESQCLSASNYRTTI